MDNATVGNDAILSPPDIEFFTRNLPKTRAAGFGRLMYDFIAMKRLKHGFGNEKTVKPHQTFKHGMRSPGSWLASSAMTMFQVYASEIEVKGWKVHRVFEAHWLEILGELGDWGPYQPTSDDKREIALGWYAEKNFADQHFDYSRIERQKTRKKNNPGDDATAPAPGV